MTDIDKLKDRSLNLLKTKLGNIKIKDLDELYQLNGCEKCEKAIHLFDKNFLSEYKVYLNDPKVGNLNGSNLLHIFAYKDLGKKIDFANNTIAKVVVWGINSWNGTNINLTIFDSFVDDFIDYLHREILEKKNQELIDLFKSIAREPDMQGKRPVDIARENGKDKFVEVLEYLSNEHHDNNENTIERRDTETTIATTTDVEEAPRNKHPRTLKSMAHKGAKTVRGIASKIGSVFTRRRNTNSRSRSRSRSRKSLEPSNDYVIGGKKKRRYKK